MRKGMFFTGILLCLIIMVGCLNSKKEVAPVEKSDVVILYTNDVHCAVDT